MATPTFDEAAVFNEARLIAEPEARRRYWSKFVGPTGRCWPAWKPFSAFLIRNIHSSKRLRLVSRISGVRK